MTPDETLKSWFKTKKDLNYQVELKDAGIDKSSAIYPQFAYDVILLWKWPSSYECRYEWCYSSLKMAE